MERKHFITEEGLQQLKQYKYKPGKYTIIDNLLNPYWEWVVSLLPLWLSPNLLTFVGWIFVILSYINMLRFDYTFEKNIPNWCFIFTAACIWTYSTLDAIDGKQARRTKTSSPLGQLFDHGCDSFSITFFILGLGQAAKLEGIEIFMLFIACQAAFWNSNWTEYNTGILKTGVGQFGVTQAELVSMIIHIITGIFGQGFWEIKIRDVLPASWTINNQFLAETLELKLGGFTAYYFGGLILVSCFYLLISTILTNKDKLKPLGQSFSFYLILALAVIWYNTSFFNPFKGMILLNFGLVCSLIICKIIISSVTKMALPYFHPEVIPMIFGTVAMLACEAFACQHIMEYIFWSVLGVNILIILNFLVGVINQITNFLGIYCFTIEKRKKV